jgi:hypothetical protein
LQYKGPTAAKGQLLHTQVQVQPCRSADSQLQRVNEPCSTLPLPGSRGPRPQHQVSAPSATKIKVQVHRVVASAYSHRPNKPPFSFLSENTHDDQKSNFEAASLPPRYLFTLTRSMRIPFAPSLPHEVARHQIYHHRMSSSVGTQHRTSQPRTKIAVKTLARPVR